MIADFATLISESKVHVLTLEQLVAGYVVSFPQQSGAYRSKQPSESKAYFLENIAVNPQQQGSGYGRLLVSHVESLARQSRCTAIELYTNELMVENIFWYTKLGFVETERKHEAGFDRVYMRLDLPAV